MADLSENSDTDNTFGLVPVDAIADPSELIYNNSINSTLNSSDNGFTNETMRLLFIAIATITTLVCLTICISVCICVCLNRRRRLKRQEKKDRLLLPEQSEKITDNISSQLPLTNPLSSNPKSTVLSNNKQQFDKKMSSSFIPQSSSSIITTKITTATGPFYYDNLDDIPFIDESRPTSYIDITRV